jgi:hypothetical protein
VTSGAGSAIESCGRVIGPPMSDVAKPIPLSQGVMNINFSPTRRFQQIYICSTHNNDNTTLSDGRAHVQDDDTTVLLLMLSFCHAASILAPSITLHGSLAVD